MSEDAAQLRRERDLYRRLLNLGELPTLEPFLEEALAFLVEVSGARRGYLEIRGESDQGDSPLWTAVDGCSPEEVENLRSVLSRGIMAETLASGEMVSTASALLDPRFHARKSVRVNRIEAVLCAPVGQDPPLGVIYLEGHEGKGEWPNEAAASVELVARQLGPFAEGLLARREPGEDATRRLRQQMSLTGVVGQSQALADALEQARLVAPLDVNVLLTGESGTGKTQLARVIHDNGPRAQGPFVSFNCATLQESLVENELFGSEAGAHSTASEARSGKVAAANGGTLFLDEVADISPAIQAKLLQLIQTREYYPLGGSEPHLADVRVIAATNSDLEQAVAEKRFRSDLYFRLQVVPIRLPALRERAADTAMLARHFRDDVSRRHRLPALKLSGAAVRAVEAAEWPGNIRELAHAIEAAVIRAAGQGAERIEAAHVFPASNGGAPFSETPETFQEATRQFQRELLLRRLEEHDWNIPDVASSLDVARSYVYKLIRAFGLKQAD